MKKYLPLRILKKNSMNERTDFQHESYESEKNAAQSRRSSLREKTAHGKKTFPYAVYHGRIPEWLDGFPLHWHDEFEIIFITYGSGIITVQGKKFLCRENDIVLIPPGHVHSILRDGKNFIAYYNILFSLTLLEENPGSFCGRRYFVPLQNGARLKTYRLEHNSELNGKLLPAVQTLSRFWEKDETDSALLIKAKLFEIMHAIRNEIIPGDESPSARNKTQRLKKILSLVEEHFPEPLTVEDAANRCALSPSRFMKVFREETGMSFIRYLNDYRLESAGEQLLTSKKSVTDIAFENGFESISYFISLFRRKFNCSPTEYRKRKSAENT